MKNRVKIMLATMVVSLFACGVAYALSWTGWASEHNEWRNCSNGDEVAFSLYCQGGYCAEIQSQCKAPTFDVVSSDTYRQSTYFSEETDPAYCAPGYVVNGFDVDGWDYNGDNIALSCIRLNNVLENNCEWTDWISEEDPNNVSCSSVLSDSYIHGMECDGGWCDNMRLFCCDYAVEEDTEVDTEVDTEDTEDTEEPAINLGVVNTETYYEVDTSTDLVIDQLASGWNPTKIFIGFASTDNQVMNGVTAVVNGTPHNLFGWWQTVQIPYTTDPVEITVSAGTTRQMRTTWWLE